MMMKGNNQNHPVKGRKTLVEPIRSQEHIEKIIALLKDKPRDKLLFVMAINNGVRTGDMLRLRREDVLHLREGGVVGIREGKTGKKNFIFINEPVYEALSQYLKAEKPRKKKTYVFQSEKRKRPLSIQAVNLMVKRWGRAVGVPDNLGAHSLRKTWGYVQRTQYNTPVELIMKRFNHSNPEVTMRYLGITPEEIFTIMRNPIGGQNDCSN